MFTGIVEGIGIVVATNRTEAGVYLNVRIKNIHSDAKIGDSISINGVCLSVVGIKGSILSFDVMQETLSRTNLGVLKADDCVNVEQSLRADSKIGGHFVTGHIDYTGKVIEALKGPEGFGFKVSMPVEYSKFVVEKGSIAVDGVSLTVAGVLRDSFTVYLIPHTLKNTTLGGMKKGSIVNIETDILAKYISRQAPKSNLEDLLKKYDYI
jgi:riboflavin synthase